MSNARTLAGTVSAGAILADGALSIADITSLETSLNAKQAALVSGTNIKTINSVSLLGSGNISISSGMVIYTTNGANVPVGNGFLVTSLSALPSGWGYNAETFTFSIGVGLWVGLFNSSSISGGAVVGGQVNHQLGSLAISVTHSGGANQVSQTTAYQFPILFFRIG